MSLALCTFHQIPAHNPTFKTDRLGPMALINHRDYCQRHGYTFLHRPESTAFAPDRPICWAKIPFLLAALEEHEWVLWADSDALILEPEIPLESFLDPRYDLLSQCPRELWNALAEEPPSEHPAPGSSASEAPDPRQLQPLNTGVFFLRSTPWTRQLLQQAWQETHFISRQEPWNGIGDQEALTAVLQRQPDAHERIGYLQDLQGHPRHHRPGRLFVHLYGNLARHRIPLQRCEQILSRWEEHIAAGGPRAMASQEAGERSDVDSDSDSKSEAAQAEQLLLQDLLLQDLLLQDLATLHWICIQHKDPHATPVRGDLDAFLYRPEDLDPYRHRQDDPYRAEALAHA
ncbi:MAG: hypothetical protein AAGD01_15725 [Acidobacteriota bacterium]